MSYSSVLSSHLCQHWLFGIVLIVLFWPGKFSNGSLAMEKMVEDLPGKENAVGRHRGDRESS